MYCVNIECLDMLLSSEKHENMLGVVFTGLYINFGAGKGMDHFVFLSQTPTTSTHFLC